MTKTINRYPGIQPFSKDYRSVFFGRSQDIDKLYKHLNVHKLTVLHGKSGLGKSSLLNAGVIPKFEENNDFKTLFIRFGSYRKGEKEETPKSIFIKKVKEVLQNDQLYFDELNLESPSIWQYFKTLQWENQDRDGILLVLDQFEEVFTYDNENNQPVETFSREFAELVNNRMPADFEEVLYEAAKNPDFLEKYGEQIQFTETAPQLKILIGIRSDRLSHLDKLSGDLPNILKNLYGLMPLDIPQAEEAIVAPAAKKLDKVERQLFGDVAFGTLPFEYDEELLIDILAFLSQGYHNTVEPFLLQIICQRIEAVVKNKSNIANEKLTINARELPPLEDIVRNYYQEVVTGKTEKQEQQFSSFEQLIVRYLLETQLIDPNRRNRISLDKTVLLQRGATDNILKILVDERLLRQEPNTVSGMSYEVSHDTLIDPILQSAAQLGDLETQLTEYYQSKVSEAEQIVLEKYFVPTERTDQIEEADKALIGELCDDQILNRHENRYSLYPMFLNIANTIRNERSQAEIKKQRAKTRQATRFAWIIGIVGLLAIGAFGFALSQYYYLNKVKLYLEESRIEALKNLELAMEEKAKRERSDINELFRKGDSFEDAGYHQEAKFLYDSARSILKGEIHQEFESLDSLQNEINQRIERVSNKDQ